MLVSVPLLVVPSSTGFPSKRCPGVWYLSRVDREISVFWHVAPPTRLHLEIPRETSLILRCFGKVGNPFQTKQGIRLPVAIRRGEGAEMKWLQEPRCSPRVRPVFQGTFGVALRVPSTISHFKTERGTSLETLKWTRASSYNDGGTTWFFLSSGGILVVPRGTQASSCVGPGTSNLPFEWRESAGDFPRNTSGQRDLI